MDLFSKITIAHFIWYLVPGLALVFFLLFPFVIIDPHLAKHLFDGLGPVGVVLFAILGGFLLDGMRLYRLRSGYEQIKKSFFDNLKSEIGAELDPYFIQSHISEVARAKENTEIGIHHAIWIMHGHIASLALLESMFWIIAASYFFLNGKPVCPLLTFSINKTTATLIYTGFAVLFLWLGNRIKMISIEDQNTTNRMFLDFTKQHKNEIMQLLNVGTSIDKNEEGKTSDSNEEH